MAKKKRAAGLKMPVEKRAAKQGPANRIAQVAAIESTTPVVTARIQQSNRERRAIERAIDQSRVKTLTAYRARFRQFADGLAEGDAKTVFAEGDSWFNYPLGRAVINQLAGLIHTPIANFAWPGAETRQLLGLREREEIEKRLRDGPARGKNWDVLLFSGGGDDIVGDQMVLFLNRGAYDPQHPERVLSRRFEEVLDLVMGAYRNLVALRDALSPNTLLVGHVYDYAWATGKGACWLGPWLRPSLDYAQVPRGDDQHKVMTAMLDRFEARLREVQNGTKDFLIVPTHQTLHTESEWANELHPKDPGFLAVARKFQAVLQERFGRNF
jgi:hypothetical protein